jgi:hypothetical protein
VGDPGRSAWSWAVGRTLVGSINDHVAVVRVGERETERCAHDGFPFGSHLARSASTRKISYRPCPRRARALAGSYVHCAIMHAALAIAVGVAALGWSCHGASDHGPVS